MKRHKLHTQDYVEHLITAIGRIRGYTDGVSRESLGNTRMIVDATMRNVGVLSVAARDLLRSDPHFATSHPQIPFQAILTLCDRILGADFTVDVDMLFRAIRHDLPELERALLQLKQP
jgi:uncharacterized protein with HEPN domain